MRLGCCVGPELIDTAADIGYDFVELSVDVLAPEQPEEAFLQVKETLASARVKPEVWDISLPPGVKVCGPSVDWPRVARYVNTALRRAAAAGGSVVAFACGDCSRVPLGFDRRDALAQATDFLRVCGAVARRHSLIVGVEPVGAKRSNLVNSVPQAMELARRVDMPEVGVLPSCLQMTQESHSLLDVVDAAAWLAHVHISAADLEAEGPGAASARELLAALHMADYDGRIAVQADWKRPDEEMKRALESLRRCCEETLRGTT